MRSTVKAKLLCRVRFHAIFTAAIWAVCLLLTLAHPPAAAAQTTAPARALRIGYLRGDPEARLSPSVFHALRDDLLSAPAVRAAMPAAGIADIVVLASDSHQDLIQRMNLQEFDMVFCTAVDFVSQSGDYAAVFQLRGARDRFDPRGSRVFSSGVVFVNNRSPLFEGGADAARLKAGFAGREVAMVGSFSAAGYIYPSLRLGEITTGSAPVRAVFWDSPEEVVKAVVNGAAEAGACDEGVIEDVLHTAGLTGLRDRLVRVVAETDPIPSDPVAVRPQWLPAESEFGREVRDEVRRFFAANPRLPRLQAVSNDRYDDVRRAMERFHALPRQ